MAASDSLKRRLAHDFAMPENPVEIVIGADAGELTGLAVKCRPESNDQCRRCPGSKYTKSAAAGRSIQKHKQQTPMAVSTFRPFRLAITNYLHGEYAEQDAWQDAQFLQPFESSGKLIQITEPAGQETKITVIPAKR